MAKKRGGKGINRKEGKKGKVVGETRREGKDFFVFFGFFELSE